jgi:hypothetical protein
MSAKNPAEQVKLCFATGAGAATKITVTNMGVDDTVTAVLNITDSAAVALTGLTMVDGGFKITASTSGKTLHVLWIDRSAG